MRLMKVFDLSRLRRRQRRISEPIKYREPFQLAIRRLEERRVLDVSAAFFAASGALEISLDQVDDTATIAADAGQLVIFDRSDQPVPIAVDSGPDSGQRDVRLSAVESVQIRGNEAANQSVILNTFLRPANGFVIGDSVEVAQLNQPVTFVTANGIDIQASSIHLSSDLEANSLSLRFGGDVVIHDEVMLSARDVIFQETINDDGDFATNSILRINSDGTTRFEGPVGERFSLQQLVTDSPGVTELAGNVSATESLFFHDSVVLTESVTLRALDAADVHFVSTVDSQVGRHFELTVLADGGSIDFSGDIGAADSGEHALGGLDVVAAAKGLHFGRSSSIAAIRASGPVRLGSGSQIGGTGITFNGSSSAGLLLQTTGDSVLLNGSVELHSDLAISTAGGDILFTASAAVDSQPNTTRRFELDAGRGAIAFHANLGEQTPLAELAVLRADAGVTFGSADGFVSTIETTGPIDLGVATNAIGGSGIVFSAGPGKSTVIRTTGDDIRLNGAVSLNSSLDLDTGPGRGDVVLTSNTTIDGTTAGQSDLTINAGAGRVSVNANIGEQVSLAQLNVVSAAGGVALGSVSNSGSALGPVNLVAADRGIHIGSGPEPIGGIGISFDGGQAGVSLTTSSNQVFINGAVTTSSPLAISTGDGPGDVVFTNESPINSAKDLLSDLMLDVGAGAVRFNASLGQHNPLGALSIVRADGGVFLGESVTKGEDGRGPVSIINSGPVQIGSSGHVITGEGIVFSGSLLQGAVLSTTNANVVLNGSITLRTDVQIETADGSGDVVFSRNSPIDSELGLPRRLQLDAGLGEVAIYSDVGSNGVIEALSVQRATSITLGAAPTVSEFAGPLGILRTVGAIDLGVGENSISEGIRFFAGNRAFQMATQRGDIRINGAARLRSDLVLSTGEGPGNIYFTKAAPVNSEAGGETPNQNPQLRIDAGNGSLSFNANIGAEQRLGKLLVERAEGGVHFGSEGSFDSALVTLVATVDEISLGATSIDAPLRGGITLNAGNNTLRFDTLIGDVTLNGPTTLASSFSVDTGAGAGDFILTTGSALASEPGESHDLTLKLGDGNARLNATIGASGPIETVRIVSLMDFTAQSPIRAARIVQESGRGNTTFVGGIELSAIETAALALTGNQFTIDSPIHTAAEGHVTVTHSGLLKLRPGSDLVLGGSFQEDGTGSTESSGRILTSGNRIEFLSPLSVLGTARLDSANGEPSLGADIVFHQSVDGSGNLELNAGLASDIRFVGPVGQHERLVVSIAGAHDVIADRPVAVRRWQQVDGSGTSKFSGQFEIIGSADAAASIRTQRVTFGAPVTTVGEGVFRVDVSQLLEIQSDASMMLDGGFQQTGGGQIQVAADIVTTNDTIQFSSPVTLFEDIRLDTGAGGGNIEIHGPLDANRDQSIFLAAGMGSITFHENVGHQQPLEQLWVENTKSLTLEGGLTVGSFVQQKGTGLSEFRGAVQVLSDAPTTIKAARVRFGAPWDTSTAGADVAVDASDSITIAGQISTGIGAIDLRAGGPITFAAQGQVVTAGGDVVLTSGASQSAAALSSIIMADGSQIASGLGTIEISAAGDVQLAQLQNTSTIQLTSRFGRILDGGDQGIDITTDALAIQSANGTGTTNPLDTEIRSFAGRNQLGGGLRLENFTDQLQIGVVGAMEGIVLGTADTPSNLPGRLEIINRGGLHVTAAVLNHSGSDSVLRAEFPGDLILDAPLQNRGGDGWMVLFAGGDLIINDSIPNSSSAGERNASAEVSVENRGAIVGIARDKVHVANRPNEFAVLRTHAERFPDQVPFPAINVPDPHLDPAGFEAAQRQIRERVAPQIINVPPQLSITAVGRSGATIDSLGRAVLRVSIGDPIQLNQLERNFHLTVDWGDGTIESYPISGTGSTARFDSARQLPNGRLVPVEYFVQHVYAENPNQENPAAPIMVHAEVRFDPRSEGELAFSGTLPLSDSETINGIRLFENLSQEIIGVDSAAFNVPGLGQEFFVKVIESAVTPVASRPNVVPLVVSPATLENSETGELADFATEAFEPEATEEYRVFVRIVDEITGEELEQEFAVPLETLDDPIGLFARRRFPNGRYRIYLEELRTQRERLILEVQIYEGRVVPQNYREEAGELQPEPPNAAEVPVDAEAATGIPDEAREGVGTSGFTGSGNRGRSRENLAAAVTAGTTVGAIIASTSKAEWRLRAQQALAGGHRKLNAAARICRRLREKTFHPNNFQR